ncbi:MAG: VWA domain-containing protein [Acidobacteria bacterium]|nr:VWA domain-containing protein [Acidobacteriota bacterium]
MRSHLIQAIGLIFLLSLAPTLHAQEDDLAGLFSDIVDVRVVNIEVVVTDHSGVSVRGLGVGDFVLEVDGVEVEIDYFSEIRGGQVVSSGGEGAMDLPAVPAIVPGEPVGTSYLVFIDDSFAFKDDRDRALEGIAEDLALLSANDRMAIVAFDGRKLDMLTSWSQSQAVLERAFDDARRRPTQGLRRLTELRQYEGNAGSRPRRANPDFTIDAETKFYVLRLADQIDRMLGGAAATLRSFAKPPGRKVMLMVTGGWPYSPTEFVNADLRLSEDLTLIEREDLYRQLSDTANLLGYTLYPADVSGLTSRWSDDPSAPSRAVAGSSAGYLSRTSGRQYSSRYLARETGGQALLLGAADRALGRVVEDTRSYYWLGFSPNRAWDDAIHSVKVRTRDGGLEIRSRKGFLDSSREAEVTMSVESAFLFGSVADTPGFEVELGAWHRAGFRKMEMPMTIALAMSELTFVPRGDVMVAALELRLAVEDEALQRAEIPVIPIVLEAPGSNPPEGRWEYTIPLRLRRQRHRALVALHDLASGRIFTAGVVIEP